MVVKKLQEEDVDGKTTAKKRILVLLPRCYVQKIIPNNTQKQRKSMQISEEDMVGPHFSSFVFDYFNEFLKS